MFTKYILSYQSLVILALLSLGWGSLSGCSTPLSTGTPTKNNPPDEWVTGRSRQLVIESNDVVEEDAKDHDSAVFLADADSIEPADLATITLADLSEAQGERYGRVRDRLLERGWMPHTFADTNGPPSDFNDSRVQEMEEIGFTEIKVCSGTGQGFCRFEFVHQDRTADNGPILVVTAAAAAPSAPGYPDPLFWEFRLEERSNLDYIDRSFDRDLLTQLRQESEFCLDVGRCEQEQYMLEEGLLIAGSGDFGSTKMSFIPHLPISKEVAIAYAKVLDTEEIIDFHDAQLDAELNSESYYEANFPVGGGAERGGVTLVHLKLTSNSMVDELSFSTIIF